MPHSRLLEEPGYASALHPKTTVGSKGIFDPKRKSSLDKQASPPMFRHPFAGWAARLPSGGVFMIGWRQLALAGCSIGGHHCAATDMSVDGHQPPWIGIAQLTAGKAARRPGDPIHKPITDKALQPLPWSLGAD